MKPPHIPAYRALFSDTANTLSLTEVAIPTLSPGRFKAAFLGSDYRTRNVSTGSPIYVRGTHRSFENGNQKTSKTFDAPLSNDTRFDRKISKPTQLDRPKHLRARSRCSGTSVLLGPTLGLRTLEV